MGVVDYTFYTEVYKGEAPEDAFPALCARASDVIGAVTHWVDFNAIKAPMIQLMYKKAICAQIDFLFTNGIDAVNDAGNGGFTVGKVTVHGKANQANGGGSLAGSVSPMAKAYLEQTGLMNPQVMTFGGW